jgi:cold shock CspA family protein
MSMQQAAPRIGRVKWFSLEHGYGFLIDEQTGQEIFVHERGLVDPGDTPVSGGRLQFVLGWESDSGKPCAVRVRPMRDEPNEAA